MKICLTRRALAAALAPVCLSILLAGGSAALAEDAQLPPEIADEVELCATCHGADGQPVLNEAPDFAPIIWGQEEYYIYVQLKDYAAGRRANDLMATVVADLSQEDMQALAAYFSKKPWPRLGFKTDSADVATANQVATAGQCTQCHLGAYVGNSRVPRMAGQSVDYLTQTLLDFKNDVRKNAADMAALVRVFPDDQLQAMARYLAGLQVMPGQSVQ
jgi:cytochrome c553